MLKPISLDIYEGEFLTLLGSSGCGKTTTLRIIAGFETPTEGNVYIEDKDVTELAPYNRDVNTVFQSYALFPHMTVFDNIAFGLKLKKLPKAEIVKKVKKVLEMVDLEGFEDRKVATLSGGQQQRIAIARALVNEPEILLLDEPLGALDLKMRKEMQIELKGMHDRLGITFIYVTHDQEEALTMSDKIVVMSEGEIQQIGTPEDIYNEPKNAFVADFIGESNIFNGIMTGKLKVRFCGAEFVCLDDVEIGTKVDAVVRPEDVMITTPEQGAVKGVVTSVVFKGVHYEIMVETVPGTSVTVNMRVIRNHDVTSEDGSEKISANNFYVDVEDVENLDDKEIVALSNAQAWETETDEYISIANIEYELEAKEGQYPVTFSTSNGTSIERTIFVVNQPFVKNEKANEGVMAFNFFKTVDEITESQALDTDLKTWANAQGWKLTDEDQSVDISVDYDFDPEEVTEGVYEITFSTTGREFKIHTTDYSEEGQEVGLTFFPEDIHVMPKVVF